MRSVSVSFSRIEAKVLKDKYELSIPFFHKLDPVVVDKDSSLNDLREEIFKVHSEEVMKVDF